MDDVLCGGFIRNRLHLIEGDPGSGKTTLALRFLIEGAAAGESVVYITLSENKEELSQVAESHGWDLSGVPIVEVIPGEEALKSEAQYTMYHPSEVEMGDATRRMLDSVMAHKPSRVVFDSLTEIKLMSQNPFRFRRQILAFKEFFARRETTVLMLDDRTLNTPDFHLHSVAHGVVTLEQLAPIYGAERRRLRIVKMRGSIYRGGFHDFTIQRGGLVIYPRLVAAEHSIDFTGGLVPSRIPEMDDLLGGGLSRGSSTLIMGPAGSGKSTIVAHYAASLAESGERSLLVLFEESIRTLLERADGMKSPLRKHVESGLVIVRQVDPAELSPGELASIVRSAVEKEKARFVAIDSLNGFLNSMPEERFLIIQLHELLAFLGQHGVISMLVVAQHGLLSPNMQAPVDASYLADSAILLRYYEWAGEVRQAISVIKKRGGIHERSLRDFKLTSSGIKVGAPLTELRGIITGVPHFGKETDIEV